MKNKDEFVQVLEEILEEYAIKSTAKDEVSNKLIQDCIWLFKRLDKKG